MQVEPAQQCRRSDRSTPSEGFTGEEVEGGDGRGAEERRQHPQAPRIVPERPEGHSLEMEPQRGMTEPTGREGIAQLSAEHGPRLYSHLALVAAEIGRNMAE